MAYKFDHLKNLSDESILDMVEHNVSHTERDLQLPVNWLRNEIDRRGLTQRLKGMGKAESYKEPSAKQRALMTALASSGYTINDIMPHVRLSRYAVNVCVKDIINTEGWWIARAQLARDPDHPNSLALVHLILTLHDAGESDASIAREIGVTRQYVHTITSKGHIPISNLSSRLKAKVTRWKRKRT